MVIYAFIKIMTHVGHSEKWPFTPFRDHALLTIINCLAFHLMAFKVFLRVYIFLPCMICTQGFFKGKFRVAHFSQEHCVERIIIGSYKYK